MRSNFDLRELARPGRRSMTTMFRRDNDPLVASERVEPLRQIYQERIDRNTIELEESEDGDLDRGGRPSTDLQLELIGAQREMLRRLTDEGSLDPQTGRRLERELDLEESRAEAAP